MKKVKTAIIPVAGYGTRFLPYTKAIPKIKTTPYIIALVISIIIMIIALVWSITAITNTTGFILR